ncbi:leucine-rich repeat serine/threonine-protein kinase 2-like isoform X2 [Ptychodera flava]|uniref:leucine-rich repeat serine/threonine-protein kinase 2-like isoform X2 n=1 Tax=Ptychodera flava TaxID=63121 RepID=UPI00396A448F
MDWSDNTEPWTFVLYDRNKSENVFSTTISRWYSDSEETAFSVVFSKTTGRTMEVSQNSLQTQEDTRDLIAKLQNELFSPEEISTATREVIALAENYHGIQVLEEMKGHAVILDVMANLKTDGQTQQVCCAALSTLLRRSEKLGKLIFSSKAHSRVMHVIDDFAENVSVLTAAIETVSLLATNERCRKRMLERNARESIIQAMTNHREDVYLQTHACAALTELLKDDSNLQLEVLVSRDYKCVVSAIENHYESLPLIEQAFRTLKTLLSTADNAKHFQSDSVHRVIVETLQKIPDAVSVSVTAYELLNLLASCDEICVDLVAVEVYNSVLKDMKAFFNDVGLQCAGCRLLTTLAYDDKAQRLLESKGSSDVIFAAMNKFQADAKIQTDALRALEKLGDIILESKLVRKQNWLGDIHTAMMNHKENADVQEAACRALCKLLQLRPEVIDNIGEDTEHDQQPTHLDLCDTLMNYDAEEHENIYKLGCSAICDIVAASETIRCRLVEQGIFVPLLRGLETFFGRKEVQLVACKALRSLVEFSHQRDKYRLSHATPLLKNISKTFITYMDDLVVVEETIKLTVSVITVDEISAALKDPDTLTAVVECMERYPQCQVVQQYGLRLLQQWVDMEWLSENPPVSDRLLRLAVCAMKTFQEIGDLQFEAWKTIKTLIDMSPAANKIYTEDTNHRELITILLKHGNNTNLLSFARTCMGNAWRIEVSKDELLLSKSKSGSLEEVECLLQLGANVDAGDGTNTPLCHACTRRNKAMVKVILRQRGNSIMKALAICLQNQSYDIVGILLAHIGIEKQGGCISWNDLGLDHLEISWFESFGPAVRASDTAGVSLLTTVSAKESQKSPLSNQLDGTFTPAFLSVKVLALSNNSLAEIPEDLSESLPNLEDVDLRCNRFAKLPPCLLKLKKLRVLDMSLNEIEDRNGYHSDISSSLLQLNLSKNRLKNVPKLLTSCTPNLEILSLAGNAISATRSCKLRNLKSLDLSNNKLQEFPEAFFLGLPALETLDLESNELKSLPPNAAEKLTSLKVVKLSRNQLATAAPHFIPKFLLNLPNLQTLDIRYNGLENLPPPSYWKTFSLDGLQLSFNNIRELDISDGIEKWKSLRRFCISDNKLKQIPKELGQVKSLTSLDFSNNDSVHRLPDELGTLSNVWELRLDGLKLDWDQILPRNSTPRDKIAFLHGRLKKDVPNCRIKLMVVGKAGRGKTTLRKCLQKKPMPSCDLATVGVEVEEWTKKRGIIDKLSKTRYKHEKYCLSTWDFAGQEDFYSTHPMFLSARSLYLVVYDLTKGREEVDSLRPWLLTIHARSPGCPVILVGTHEDKLPEEGKEDYLREMREHIEQYASPEFPNINLQKPFEICGTTFNEGVKQLKRYIFEVIDNYKIGREHVIGQMIPQSYVQLQDTVLETAKIKSVLKYDDLVALVRDRDIQLTEDELPHAIKFLHQSGVLLHYDDPALHLRDLYFIDPQWLCKMMAKIVTVKEINPFIDNNGVMKKAHLAILLKGCDFSIEAYQSLMQKFEIAVPKGEDELLIPSKMSETRPDIDLGEIQQRSLLTRHYKMQYIPIGFWSKLIARLILFSRTVIEEVEGQPVSHKYWKEGMYIHWSQEACILLESIAEEQNCFRIVVPYTKEGKRLLGYVVDHTDDLIEEWYPGLTEVLPTGEESIVRTSPCPECGGAHHFDLADITSESNESDFVVCTEGNNNIHVSLDRVAPDVLLEDLDTLKLDNFTFDTSILLGNGACGKVYKATYKTQDVAVKVFDKYMRGDFHSHRTLRQEVTVLRRLSHISVVSMVGVTLRPSRVLVMELAPLGSLRDVIEGKKRLSRVMQHRIALQVAEGLEFLHSQGIIYRDLKPDNVLMYSLSTTDAINAKISDYGISGFASLVGLTSSVGTLGYKAPEVAQKDVLYDEKVDIFSFGVLLHELEVGPSAYDLAAQGQLTASLREGRKDTYPDLRDLTIQCVSHLPEQRPSSKDVVRRLRSLDLLCLKRVIKVFDDYSVEAAAIRKFQDGGERKMELWVAGGKRKEGVVAWTNISNKNEPETVHMLKGGKKNSVAEERIESLICLGSDTVMFSNAKNRVWACDSRKHECEFEFPKLEDSVPCLQSYDGYFDEGVVFAGLANGQIALYSTAKLKSGPCKPEKYIKISENEAIVCMSIARNKLWIGCGTQVMSLTLDPFSEVAHCEVPKTNRSSIITHIDVGRQLVICRRNSPDVEVWTLDDNDNANVLANRIQCDSIIRSTDINANTMDCYVKSMFLESDHVLWVGTDNGYILWLDPETHAVIDKTRRYTGPVKVITSSEDSGEDGESSKTEAFVMTVGEGFVKTEF